MVTFPIPEHVSAKAAPKAFICHMRHLQSSSDDFPELWLQMPGTKIAQVPIQDEMTYQQMKLKKGWFQDIWLLFCSTLKDIVPEELEELCYRWVVEEQRSGKSFWNPSDYYFSDIIKQKLGNEAYKHALWAARNVFFPVAASHQKSELIAFAAMVPTAEPEEVFFCSKVSGVPPIPGRRFQ